MKSNRTAQGFALANPRVLLNTKLDYLCHFKGTDLMRTALLSASFLFLLSAPKISWAEPNAVDPSVTWQSRGQTLNSLPSGTLNLFSTHEQAFSDIANAHAVLNSQPGVDIGTPENLAMCASTDTFFLGRKVNGKIPFYYCYYLRYKDNSVSGPFANISAVLECPVEKYTWIYQENLSQGNTIVRCAVPQGQSTPTTDPAPLSCPTKQPVFAETGVKIQRELDYQDAAGLLNVERIWRSDLKRFVFPGANAVMNLEAYQAAGACHAGIANNTNGGDKLPYCFPYAPTPLADPVVEVQDARGSWNRYNATTLASAPDVNEPLTDVKDATGKVTSWRVRKPSHLLETYDAATGQLTRRAFADGRFVTYTYSTAATPPATAPRPGLLLQMSDHNARSVQFTYSPKGLPATLTLPDGQLITYAYDEPSANCPSTLPAGSCQRLSSVTYPDGKVRRYHYNEATHLDASLSPLVSYLTGITDERGVRFSNYRYDAAGRAVSSGWGGFNDQFSYGATQTDITDPLGSTRTVSYQSLFGKRRPISQSQPAGSGCAASTSAQSWDANANPASRDDFNGSRSCFAHDLNRNLETTRVEGLANTATCSAVTPANVVLPSGSRKTSTQWHPDWRLPSKVAEAGRITTQVYNGQPDPFNGNAIASCAPAGALLPDGKPIAVLCKQVEQATTDVNGSLGFSAALQTGVAARTTQWLYNAQGQVLREDGPRADVSDVSTYSYYADTTADHRLGDLKDMSDASGQITQFTRYNAHGQLLQSVDANGVVSTFTYDLRQHPTSQTVGAQTASYTYDAAGQLTLVTQADGSTVRYTYDTAQRLTAVADNRGNRIDYTLDANGNRTAENAKDPGGLLKRQLARNIDALSRLQKATGRE